MVERICLGDGIAKLSGHYIARIKERHSPDNQDHRLQRPTALRSSQIPQVEPFSTTLGGPAAGAVVAILLFTNRKDANLSPLLHCPRIPYAG